MIGRLMIAETMPSTTELHQTTSYEPVCSCKKPPRNTPRKPPTWWLKKAKPNKVAIQRVPNINATSADVGGTVESHSRPMAPPKTMAEVAVTGSEMNTITASERSV